MKKFFKIMIIYIGIQCIFLTPSFAKDPFDLFFIQEVTSGRLVLNAKNQGKLIVTISDAPLVSFNASHQQKLTGYVELSTFIKSIKNEFNKKTFNAVLILDNPKDTRHKNFYILALTKPNYNFKNKQLSYDVLLLMHQSAIEIKTINFNHALIFYNQVCVSCIF